jgi:hypothetical protein
VDKVGFGEVVEVPVGWTIDVGGEVTVGLGVVVKLADGAVVGVVEDVEHPMIKIETSVQMIKRAKLKFLSAGFFMLPTSLSKK